MPELAFGEGVQAESDLAIKEKIGVISEEVDVLSRKLDAISGRIYGDLTMVSEKMGSALEGNNDDNTPGEISPVSP